jgi:hypothetical protein
LLTILLYKINETNSNIKTFIYSITYINKFVPNETKDYDILYLYLYALEIIEKFYINPNKLIIEKVNEYKSNLSHFGSIYTKDLFRKLKNSFIVNNAIKNSKIQPNTSLGMKLIEYSLDSILSKKKNDDFKEINDDTFTTDDSKVTERMIIIDENMKALIKLQEKKIFKDYNNFFFTLTQSSMNSLEDIKYSIGKLFPLIPYFSERFDNDDINFVKDDDEYEEIKLN